MNFQKYSELEAKIKPLRRKLAAKIIEVYSPILNIEDPIVSVAMQKLGSCDLEIALAVAHLRSKKKIEQKAKRKKGK